MPWCHNLTDEQLPYTSIAVDDKYLLLFGGRNEAGRTLGDAWVFEIAR
jgi:hypothetical protein